jgi:outer membrane protein assembly factor BamD
MDITESRISACERILAEYELYVGNFYFKKGSYQAAVQRFNGLLKDYPDSKNESEALYYLGLSYENMGQRDEAIYALNLLIKKFPTIELSNEARELLASFDSKK